MQSSFAEDAEECLPKVLTENDVLIMKVRVVAGVTPWFSFCFFFFIKVKLKYLHFSFFVFAMLVSGAAGFGAAFPAFPLTQTGSLQPQSAR